MPRFIMISISIIECVKRAIEARHVGAWRRPQAYRTFAAIHGIFKASSAWQMI